MVSASVGYRKMYKGLMGTESGLKTIFYFFIGLLSVLPVFSPVAIITRGLNRHKERNIKAVGNVGVPVDIPARRPSAP